MRIVCGLDVHKDSIFLCILSSTGEIFEKKDGVLTSQLEEMRDLMLIKAIEYQENKHYFTCIFGIFFVPL